MVHFFIILTFLAPVTFRSLFKDFIDQKVAGAKKFILTKNQFFYARQPREQIFEICSYRSLIFTPVCLSFGHSFHFSASTNQNGY